jgi:hypothetical protein
MTTQFPTQLDNYADVPQNQQQIVKHRDRHQNIEDAMEAVQETIGVTGSTDPDSIQYRLNNIPTNAALAGPNGSNLVGFIQDGAGSVARTSQGKMRESLSPQDKGAVANGVADDTAAIQSAINHVISIATATGKTYGLPSIEIPGGWYKLTDSLTLFPWVHLVANGNVFFDFSGMAVNKPGIICNNLTSIAEDSLKFPGNHAPFLDGSGGGFAILGPGKATSTAPALKLGNFVGGGKPFRDARICNVVITGWDSAQEWGNFDTYLCSAEDCRFESNNIQIKTQSTAGGNSGERMEWRHCTFSGATTVLSHNITTFDANFSECSFDFNGDIVKFGANSNYCAVRFQACYFESFGGYIVDGSLLTGTPTANQVAVMVEEPIILPRAQNGAAGVNSPSRQLFRGQFSLSLTNPKIRYETRPYLEDGSVIASDVVAAGVGGYHIVPWAGPLRIDVFTNDDYDFQRDANLTSGAALTAWDQVSIAATVNTIDTVSGKKVLKMVGSSGTNSSNATFRSKRKTDCQAGDVMWANTCIFANGVTGAITVQPRIEFFDAADVSLLIAPSGVNYSFSAALADPTLPNFGSGGNRYMDTEGVRAVAPKNTAYAKMRFTVTSFDGTVLVSRARMWKNWPG